MKQFTSANDDLIPAFHPSVGGSGRKSVGAYPLIRVCHFRRRFGGRWPIVVSSISFSRQVSQVACSAGVTTASAVKAWLNS
jgi:hypothetical protein